MKIGSLFSGAGGLDMAVEEVFQGEVVWHSEIDKSACQVLSARFPSTPNLGDISLVNWNAVTRPDIICGGFPCQDLSVAGSRSGINDKSRSGLWSEMARIIGLHSPQYVVIENVKGILSASGVSGVEHKRSVMGRESDRPILRAIGTVLGDLADIGYDAQWATVAASEIGAPHRRERVFIVAAKEGELPDLNYWGKAENDRVLLPTPTVQDGANNAGPSQFRRNTLPLNAQVTVEEDWGKYKESINLWEKVFGPAPEPTQNLFGKKVLNPEFSEWMMGWPFGWVTDPDIGISRSNQLKIIGNGVVKQQAVYAIKSLLNQGFE